MPGFRHLFAPLLAALLLIAAQRAAPAQQTPQPQTPAVKSIEIAPATAEVEVGQKVQFSVIAKDAAGNRVDTKPTAWFAAPFDVAVADQSGVVTFFEPGEATVGAIVGGKPSYARVRIRPPKVARIDIDPLGAPLVVGATAQLNATARVASGNPRRAASMVWASENPKVAVVDAAGVVTALAEGRATVRASCDGASGAVTVDVGPNPVRRLSIEPRTTSVRAGDVVRFSVKAADGKGAPVKNPAVRWAVSGEGAIIGADGGFVAEQPGSYVVTAISGDRIAVASVAVAARNVERDIVVVGRAPLKDMQAAELWVTGNYVYVSTIADKIFVYDISDPAKPKQVGSLAVDARLVNDISTTPDGRIGVLTRENASSRKNGIVFFDASDPANLKVISEYTATVTGGVHSAFIDGHYVYLTDDATGSLRVIDFKDVKNPTEVARWQVENPLAVPVKAPFSESTGGRYLHDVYVKDGLIYLAYWRDGLVILDVGNGIKGGRPENPRFVSQFRFNHHELYGDDWLAGTHTVYRYKNYVFVGDEVFPPVFDIQSKNRIPTRGIVHVIDVSDIERPRKVAEYNVPEAGAHNIWVEDDILYMGYYNGGGRILDVSGELRGDLYRQGRELGRLWTADASGFRPNLPLTWGAQPHGGLVYFNDINTGLWIVKLGGPRFKGSTTATPSN